MPVTVENRAASFRNNVRRLLHAHSMSQREAADRFEISYKSMRRFCHYGLNRPDKRTRAGLERLARHFGLTLADLWEPGSPEKGSPPDAENILNNLDRYCGDRFIEIPRQYWCVLAEEAAKKDQRKQEIAEQLADVLGQYEAPCPQISQNQRRNDFDLFMALPDERESVSRGK